MHFTWNRADVAVDQARSHGINVLATLDYTPAWARTNQTSDHYPPDDPDTYATFAKTTVQRYHDRVHDWEIWNEPNYWRFWLPKPDVAAHDAAEEGVRGHQVGRSHRHRDGGRIDGQRWQQPATTFLQNIYDNNGGTSNGLFDAVAWHPLLPGPGARPSRPIVGAPGTR